MVYSMQRLMPKIAVISDIHSNLHALYSVMEDWQSEGCTDVVCLGDIVGYNAYPQECIEAIRSLQCVVVKGEHEDALLKPDMLQSAHMSCARHALDWTMARLSSEAMQWLSRLPYKALVHSSFMVSHAGDRPVGNTWRHIKSGMDAASCFKTQMLPVAFCGHSHCPAIYSWQGSMGSAASESMEELQQNGMMQVRLSPHIKHLIDVGSVGQPQDGDPRACYVVYDSDEQVVTFRRVDYDRDAAAQAIEDSGLPVRLAERLMTGLYA